MSIVRKAIAQMLRICTSPIALLFLPMNQPSRSLQDLLSSAEKYLLIVENAQNGILILDTDGQVVYSNSMFAELLGLSQTTIIGNRLLYFCFPYAT